MFTCQECGQVLPGFDTLHTWEDCQEYKKSCKWTQEDPEYGRWNSGCGETFDLAAYSNPEENDMRYCPFCGKSLEMVEPPE